MIELRTLGAPAVRVGEDSPGVAIPAKELALLAYLAVEASRAFLRRDTLVALFWPELDEKHARQALSQEIYRLRQRLRPEALLSRGNEELGISERVRCDAVAFRDKLAAGRPALALELYRGEFLEGLHVPGAPEFERWLDRTRQALRKEALDAALDLADREEKAGNPAGTARWLDRALALAPTDEQLLQRLMLSLEVAGDRSGAIRAYQSFAERLADELELTPSVETVRLAETIRSRRIGDMERPPDDEPEKEKQPSMPTLVEARSAPGVLDPTASGVAETLPRATRTQVSRRGAVAGIAFGLLFGLAALYFVSLDRGRGLAPGDAVTEAAVAEAAAAGIAVMPFEVSGADLEEWREGMVILLSTGLDGAGNLRAIDSRTVLAQWDRHMPGGSRADREMALQVARATGARYALLGSAVLVGPELRLVADVYSVDDGSRLGTAQVEGAPDRVLALVDDLVRETLGVILEKGEGEIPPVHLAALTTSSLPALKAFLEGEALYRRGRIEESVAAYDRAVEADSTFALAWNRLATAYSWLSAGQFRFGELSARAMRYADRLPERERLLVEVGFIGHTGFTFEGLNLVREVTRKYPDDAYAWYQLGEYYLHFKRALVPLDDAEEAFLRAVELDPTFAPYRYHPTELAFSNPPDSALAAERVRELTALDPDGLYAQAGRLALALAFGNPVRRPAILDSIRSLDAELVDHVTVFLRHPRFWELEEELLKIAADKGYLHPDELFWGNILKRGLVTEALQYIDMPGGPSLFPTRELWEAHGLGIPIPEAVLEAHLTIQPADSTAGLLTALKGVYALDRDRREDYSRVLAVHRRALARGRAEGDSTLVRNTAAILQALEGYERWRKGDPRGALPLLQDAFRMVGGPYPLAFWIGQIYLELGRPADAVPYLQARRAWWYTIRDPLADYYAGVALEQAGEFQEARQAYGSLVEHWRDPDPELRPFVDRARQGMIRVSGIRKQ